MYKCSFLIYIWTLIRRMRDFPRLCWIFNVSIFIRTNDKEEHEPVLVFKSFNNVICDRVERTDRLEYTWKEDKSWYSFILLTHASQPLLNPLHVICVSATANLVEEVFAFRFRLYLFDNTYWKRKYLHSKVVLPTENSTMIFHTWNLYDWTKEIFALLSSSSIIRTLIKIQLSVFYGNTNTLISVLILLILVKYMILNRVNIVCWLFMRLTYRY